MKRKKRIVISITGIVLVALILVGLTYAYFLTNITGNTNNKSISVTTTNLSLVYGDGNTSIITKQNILPGDVIGEKDFTVTNEGNGAVGYMVVIDNVSITEVTSGDSTTFESNDFIYTLTCVQKNKNTNEVSGTCIGVNEETTLPLTDETILVSNNIAENMRHEYVLTVTYKETGIDQSADMNKRLEAKVDIKDIKYNPFENGTLAYNIINNSVKKTNGTVLRAQPLTSIAAERNAGADSNGPDYEVGEGITEWTNVDLAGQYWIYYDDTNSSGLNDAVEEFAQEGDPSVLLQFLTNQCSDTIGKYIIIASALDTFDVYYIEKCNGNTPIVGDVEKTLSVTVDDYGTSYYFRGNPTDNYVNFANKCWRIVRIEGDGSVKLVLEDQDNTCQTSDGNWNIPTTTGGNTITGNFGYEYNNKYIASYLNPVTNADRSQIYAYYNFQNSLGSSNLNKLKSGNWCYDDTAYTENDGSVITDKSSYYDNGREFYYDSYVRLSGYDGYYKPTLKCNGIILDEYSDVTYNSNQIISAGAMKVAALTADEIVYAGTRAYTSNPNYYLINDYQKDEELYWGSLSPYVFNGGADKAFSVDIGGGLGDDYVDHPFYSFRPAVSLLSGTTIQAGGDGTKNNPYVIN